MSENKRTPEQILEQANAFLEKAGVTAALDEFLNSERVREVVLHQASICEEDMRKLVSEQEDELAAKAETLGICDEIAEGFCSDFAINFRIFMFLDHIEVLKAYGMQERTCYGMVSHVLSNKSEILYQLVNTVCGIQWEKQFKLMCEWLEQLEFEEDDVDGPEPITHENCGETKCLYDEECREQGFCLKGKEFHCNGKGKAEGECNCPCVLSCNPGLHYPCEELEFTVIPPEGGCCEQGVK
ncbi:MAG: hypothetical protein IJE68_05980 [Clostridia bacterium]|nr:hypothetical protein [Clostridia bacterium]